MMKAHGFTIDDIPKWGGSFVLGNSSIGLDAIVDDKADVFMNVRNLGDSLIKDVASKRPLMWIDDDPAKTSRLRRRSTSPWAWWARRTTPSWRRTIRPCGSGSRCLS